jgi:hypothetical protein
MVDTTTLGPATFEILRFGPTPAPADIAAPARSTAAARASRTSSPSMPGAVPRATPWWSCSLSGASRGLGSDQPETASSPWVPRPGLWRDERQCVRNEQAPWRLREGRRRRNGGEKSRSGSGLAAGVAGPSVVCAGSGGAAPGALVAPPAEGRSRACEDFLYHLKGGLRPPGPLRAGLRPVLGDPQSTSDLQESPTHSWSITVHDVC